MDLNTVSRKSLNEIEHALQELRAAMRKANLHNEPLAKALQEFETEIGNARRERFDASNPEYTGY